MQCRPLGSPLFNHPSALHSPPLPQSKLTKPSITMVLHPRHQVHPTQRLSPADGEGRSQYLVSICMASRKRPLAFPTAPSPSSSKKKKQQQQQPCRTVLVVGLSPACFETEVLMIWPKKKQQPKGVRLVWVNTGDAPAKLPSGWAWDEVHRCSVEALPGMQRTTQGWGELYVIMGAGTSVQDFASLKQDSDSMYPFEKELLQASSDADCFNREGKLIMEPLCVTTLRFMAGLRKAFLERDLPSFHRWLADHAARVVGVLTFNIDSLEFLALAPSLHHRIVQFHGNITQLTTVQSLAMPYSTRSVAERNPPAWSDVAALERVASPLTTLTCLALDMASDVFMGCRAVGVSRSMRQVDLDKQVIAASHRMCRGEQQDEGEEPLSLVSLARANSLVKEKMKHLFLGNCVFTGEHNDAKLAKCAAVFLRGFMGFKEGDEFGKVEGEVRAINKQRGVGPEHLADLLQKPIKAQKQEG